MIKISSDIPGRIKVAFSYNPEYVAKIKTVKAHRRGAGVRLDY